MKSKSYYLMFFSAKEFCYNIMVAVNINNRKEKNILRLAKDGLLELKKSEPNFTYLEGLETKIKNELAFNV